MLDHCAVTHSVEGCIMVRGGLIARREHGAAAILQEELATEMRSEVLSWVRLVKPPSALVGNV